MRRSLATGFPVLGDIEVAFSLLGDAHHLTSPPPDGEGGMRAMRMALKEGGMVRNDIVDAVDYINAHATSTPTGDLAELCAISSLFSPRDLGTISISSTKVKRSFRGLS